MTIENCLRTSNADFSDIQFEPALAAYVKRIDDEEGAYFAVYDSKGEPLAIAPNRELAFVVIRQHDLIPFDVH